jgi:hypothetical protein
VIGRGRAVAAFWNLASPRGRSVSGRRCRKMRPCDVRGRNKHAKMKEKRSRAPPTASLNYTSESYLLRAGGARERASGRDLSHARGKVVAKIRRKFAVYFHQTINRDRYLRRGLPYPSTVISRDKLVTSITLPVTRVVLHRDTTNAGILDGKCRNRLSCGFWDTHRPEFVST